MWSSGLMKLFGVSASFNTIHSPLTVIIRRKLNQWDAAVTITLKYSICSTCWVNTKIIDVCAESNTRHPKCHRTSRWQTRTFAHWYSSSLTHKDIKQPECQLIQVGKGKVMAGKVVTNITNIKHVNSTLIILNNTIEDALIQWSIQHKSRIHVLTVLNSFNDRGEWNRMWK